MVSRLIVFVASMVLFASQSFADICAPVVWGFISTYPSGTWVESSESVGDASRLLTGWSNNGTKKVQGIAIWDLDQCSVADGDEYVFRATVVDAYSGDYKPLTGSLVSIYGFSPDAATINMGLWDVGIELGSLEIPTTGDFFQVVDSYIRQLKSEGRRYVGLNIRSPLSASFSSTYYEFTAGTPNHYETLVAESFGTLSGGSSYSAIGGMKDFGIPEPASLSLLAIGGMMLAARRR